MTNPRNLLDFLFLFFIHYLHTNPITRCFCAAYMAFIVYSKLHLSHTINLCFGMLSLWLPHKSRVFRRIRNGAEGEEPTGRCPRAMPTIARCIPMYQKSNDVTRNASNGACLRVVLFFHKFAQIGIASNGAGLCIPRHTTQATARVLPL